MSEHIINTEQIKGITPYLLAEKKIPSWLACWALWDVGGAVPQRKDDGLAIGLPEIVRCRDCKHYDTKQTNGYDRTSWCCVHAEYAFSDDYCSWGEQRGQ